MAGPAVHRPARAAALVVLLFALIGVANSVFPPFASVVLVERGITPTWLGVMGAAIALLYVGLAGVWGHLADVALGRGRALATALAISGALVAVVALPLPVAAVGLAYVGFSTVYGMLYPLADALAVNTLPDPVRQYGPVRGLQSGTFAAGSLAAGAAWGVLGYGGAIPAFLVLVVPVAIVAWRVPDAARATLTTTRRGGAVREALTVQPRLPRALLAIGLGNVGVFATLTFLPLLVVRLGGGPEVIGLAVGVTALVEVAALPAVSRLIVRFGPRAVVSVGVALLAAVFAWLALAPSPVHVVAASVLYGVAWSAMWAGSVATVRALLPAALQGTGQSLLALATAGLAAFAANLGGGLLWAGPGPIAVFGLAAACALAGAGIGWQSLPRDAGSGGGARGEAMSPGSAAGSDSV